MCKNFEENNTHIKSLVFLLMCKDFEKGAQILKKVHRF